MRDFLIFLVVLAIVFFAVGEWRGWFLGVPSSTPIFVYKKDFTALTTRRTINQNGMAVRVTGRVQNGSVTIFVVYENRGSFQEGTDGSIREDAIVFEETYRVGQTIAINELFEEGVGFYQIRMVFEDATGLFRVILPQASQL